MVEIFYMTLTPQLKGYKMNLITSNKNQTDIGSQSKIIKYINKYEFVITI